MDVKPMPSAVLGLVSAFFFPASPRLVSFSFMPELVEEVGMFLNFFIK